MTSSRQDGQWTLWTWQRFQQLVGAALIAVPAGFLLFYLAKPSLPPEFEKDIAFEKYDHREVDHFSILRAIGSCHPDTTPIWTPVTTNPMVLDEREGHQLVAFERAALWQSERIVKERERFLHEAEERQDRARHNQIRVLCLSAAAAFLVALRALAAGKDEDAAFRSLMKGALLPISVLALLMPVLATAVSGIAAFDGDANIVLRHVRTLAQLEQLHGRIAEDVTGDPFLCPITRATAALSGERSPAADRTTLAQCLMDRMARTVAWEQRHERILNEATQSLAHAGDLPGGGDKPKPVAAKPEGSGDPCEAAFGSTANTAMSRGRQSG